MKPVRKTIALPEDLLKFAAEKSKAKGEPLNLSQYVRELIRQDRQHHTQKKAA